MSLICVCVQALVTQVPVGMATHVFIRSHLDVLGVPSAVFDKEFVAGARSQLDMLGVHPAGFDKEFVCRGTRGTRLGLVHRSSS